MTKIYTPWEPWLVRALNGRQRLGSLHPYTCPREHLAEGEKVKLIATPDGWICSDRPRCDYTQDWANGPDQRATCRDRRAWLRAPEPAPPWAGRRRGRRR